MPAPATPAAAAGAPSGATTQTRSAASAATIARPSARPNGTGKRSPPCIASQLRVKLGTIRPPMIITSSA